MTRKGAVEELAESVGIHVSTWSPGDGATRYRFHRGDFDYNAGNELATVLGRKNALMWLRAFKRGLEAR